MEGLSSFKAEAALFFLPRVYRSALCCITAHHTVPLGTTIGYGDLSPKSELGKIAIAIYVILVVNVVAALLEPAKHYLESFCHVRNDDMKLA